MGDYALRHPQTAARLAFEKINTQLAPTMDSLMADIRTATGKELDIREIPQLGQWGAAALWMDLPDRHLILESQPMSDHHHAWVRAHELGHIVFAHFGWAQAPDYSALNGDLCEALKATQQHQLDLRRPAEQAAEEFARYADLRIREAHGGVLNNDYTVALA